MISLLEQENTKFSTLLVTLLFLMFYFQIIAKNTDNSYINLILICLSLVWITLSLFFV